MQHFPRLSALGPALFELDPDGDFEFGLDLLLGSLAQARLDAGSLTEH